MNDRSFNRPFLQPAAAAAAISQAVDRTLLAASSFYLFPLSPPLRWEAPCVTVTHACCMACVPPPEMFIPPNKLTPSLPSPRCLACYGFPFLSLEVIGFTTIVLWVHASPTCCYRPGSCLLMDAFALIISGYTWDVFTLVLQQTIVLN